MMISVSGKRGIGKTYHLAKVMYRRYRQNFFIISNFTHLYSHIDCSKESPEILYEIIKELGIFKERGYELCDLDPRFTHSGVFIGIDEAHLYFSADLFKRYQADASFQYILKFLAQARKSDVEIWYSVQDPAKIDKNWRRYTESYIRYVPVIPWYVKKNILIKRPKRPDGTEPLPYYRREIRYPIPLVWEEHHQLDQENPVFDYSMMKMPDGSMRLSPFSTLKERKLVRAGWMDTFPYKLYDSYQMLAMQGDPQEKDFRHLTGFSYIEHTMQKETFPTIKGILHLPRRDAVPPTRYVRKDLRLPEPLGAVERSQNVLKQPVEFLDDLHYFNRLKKNSNFKRIAKLAAASRQASDQPTFKDFDNKQTSVGGE